ncbi:MAG: cadherin domain-containing protein [Bacteroidota bacterium]
MSRPVYKKIKIIFYLLLIILTISCQDDSSDNVNLPPVIEDQNFSIAENSTIGTVVGTIIASDPENDVLSFTIESGNTGNAFALDTNSGELSVSSSDDLDFETSMEFSLSVAVADGSNSSAAVINISVTDVNENSAPVVNDQVFVVDENSITGTVVGTVLAQDSEQTELFFSISAGNIDEAFEIEISSGELSVNVSEALDFETNPVFNLEIEVSDGSLTATADVTINLNDVTPETFTTIEQINAGLQESYLLWKPYLEFAYLFDAIYANTITSPSADWEDVFNHTLTSSNLKVKRLWDDAYALVFLLNNVITSAEQVLPDGEEKDQIIGQALVIRSYLYFNLAEWFNMIPIQTDVTGAAEPATQKSEVLSMVKLDLNVAAATLPNVWDGSNSGNVTSFTADALNIRILNSETDFSGALSESTELRLNGGFSLGSNPNLFEANDPEIIWGFEQTGESTFSSVYPKGNFVPFVRLTESFLISARSHIANFDDAGRVDLNTLRDRSGDSQVANGSSPSELTDVLVDQWQTEMDFEGNIFFILRLFDLAEAQLSIENFRLLLPIPQAEIDINENLTQNPGY